MSKGYWMVRTTKSGNIIEKSQFWIGEKKPRASRKKGSTLEPKAERNLSDAIKRLARTLNCNYKPGDLFITLTYDKKPESAEAAAHETSKFMRRLARAADKHTQSAPPRARAVWVDADKNSDGIATRIHHHMVIGSELFEVRSVEGKIKAFIGDRDIAEIWGLGYVDVEPIKKDTVDMTPIAAYMVRQAVGGPDVKKWHCTRGLEKPVIIDEEITEKPHELRAPAGADVHEISHYDEQTGFHYIRYTRKPRADAPPERPPEKKPITHISKRDARRRL